MANIDTTEHNIDEELTTGCEQKVTVWACLMTQYNLKPGLQMFREKEGKSSGVRVDANAYYGHLDRHGS
jgi:hypothetical protein